MRYRDIMKLTEADKSRFIDSNENLTDEQKLEVKEFFRKHNEQDGKIDWQKSKSLTYNDFFKVMKNFNERFLPKFSLSDLKEGEDYVLLGKDSSFKYYLIKTYKASVVFASNNVKPEVWGPLCDWYMDNSATGEETNWQDNVVHDYPQRINEKGKVEYGGAKWCISINHTQKFWNDYMDEDSRTSSTMFVFAISISEFTTSKKFAIHTEYKYKDTLDYNYFNFLESSAELVDIYDSNDISDDTYKPQFQYFIDTMQIQEQLYQYLLEMNNYLDTKLLNFEKLKDTVPNISYKFRNTDFPFFKAGTRTEGDVYMSRHTTPIEVPCSPTFIANDNTKEQCIYRWDTSIIRQWLNSDLPAGQWYQEPKINGYMIRWEDGNAIGPELNFIKNTDGFLKIMGISKSDLNLVKNYSYCDSDDPIVTEDYVWIPSIAELAKVESDVEKPLDFWSKAHNAVRSDEIYIMGDSPYLCRDGFLSSITSYILYIDSDNGRTSRFKAQYAMCNLAVLMSPKHI